MRIKDILVFCFFLLSLVSVAQIEDPVDWSFRIESSKEREAVLICTATIQSGWHIYALKVSDDPNAIGPLPTVISLDPSSDYKAKGSPSEGKYITHFDKNFELDLNYFEGKAIFKQVISLKKEGAVRVTGRVEYMACNDEKCIFPDPELFEASFAPEGTEPLPATVSPTDTGEQKRSGMLEPVKWKVQSNALADGNYEIVYTAIAETGWHVYSQNPGSTEGPEPTRFKYETGDAFETIGPTQEGTPIRKYDPNFMADLAYFENGAVFKQVVRPVNAGVKELKTSVEFMVCNEEMCLPPREASFKVNLTTGVGVEFDPLANAETASLENDPFKLQGVDLNNPVNDCGEEKGEITMWLIFLFGLIGGLLALATPCVFPMIPLTVSFFTKGAGGKNGKVRATTYGLFIVLIYFLLSLPFHLSKNVDPEVLNNIATNVYLNVFFFVIFIFFALSFFGFYDISLPSGLANKVDNASNIGGVLGIFFMALTLVIVSFSCTGPVLGSVIGSVYASSGAGTMPFLGLELSVAATKITVAMLGFGIALGLPFALFAAFPGMLKSLPKSGGWLDDFKVSLGFIEVALAIKFISNADLVLQMGLLKREVFFATWIVVGVAWVLYLLGKFRFKKGQGTQKISATKWGFIVVISLFTLRLVPGVMKDNEWNKFKFLSGFPPPKSYSIYPYQEEMHVYKNLAEAIEVAKREKKPLFLDFTGWACVNCRKMEENVWVDEKVKALLEQEFIVVSLYVDEKKELPEEEQFIYTTTDGRKKEIKTVGSKWATLQTQTFQNNSQPYYALLSPDGTLLNPPRGYTPEAKEYAEWLNCGLQALDLTPAAASVR